MPTPESKNRPGSPHQIALVEAMARELARQGFPDANTRQLNAVIQAAADVCDEFGRPHNVPAPGAGLAAWAASDDTGLSSKALARAVWPENVPKRFLPRPGRGRDGTDYPLDPSDFGRCVRMLNSEPGLRDRLHLARTMSPVWERLVDHWDELESLYAKESPSGKAPNLYARLKELIGDGGTT